MTTPAKRSPAKALKKDAPKNRGGHPTLLTPEVERELVANRSLGLTIKRSCELAGVSYDSFNFWLNTGRTETNKPAGKRTDFEQKCVTFYQMMTKVDSEWMKRCEIINALALTPGENQSRWSNATPEERQLASQTARWKLANQAPSEYSTKTQTELSGKVVIEEEQTDLMVRALEAALEVVPVKYHEKARTEMARVLRSDE